MKKLSFLLMFAALGIFSLGCEPQKSTVPVDSDHTSTDTGEEKPAVPAAETKPEEKATEEKTTEEKATEEKPTEEKPTEEKPAETKPEEKPADEPKPEEKPSETPTP